MTAEELRERRNPNQQKRLHIEAGDYVKIVTEPVRRWYVAKITGRGAVLSAYGLQRVVPLKELRYSPTGER